MRQMSTAQVEIARYDMYNLYLHCNAIYQKKWLSKADARSIITYINQLLADLSAVILNAIDCSRSK